MPSEIKSGIAAAGIAVGLAFSPTISVAESGSWNQRTPVKAQSTISRARVGEKIKDTGVAVNFSADSVVAVGPVDVSYSASELFEDKQDPYVGDEVSQNMELAQAAIAKHSGWVGVVLLLSLAIGVLTSISWLFVAPVIIGCVGILGSLGIQLSHLEEM